MDPSDTGGMPVLRRNLVIKNTRKPTTPHSPLPTRGAAAHPTPHSRRSRRAPHSPLAAQPRAFTLLEVILAVTIAGALLAAAASLMVSVSTVWMERQDRHFFEDHVDGVSEFLQACFTRAGTAIAKSQSDGESTNGPSASSNTSTGTIDTPTAGDVTIDISYAGDTGGSTSSEKTNSAGGSSLISTAEDPVSWSKPPGYADYQDPLLNFGLKDTPALLIQTEDAPTVGVEAFLYFDKDEGLSLLWFTPLQEDSEDLNDLRRTPISDLITKFEYVYWDERFEKWETETEPKEGEGEEQYILPRFLKLTFEYQGETKERTLTIPVPSQSALIF